MAAEQPPRSFMNCLRSIAGPVLVLLLSAAATLAHADEVADVNQLARTGQATEAMAKLDQFLAVKPKDPQLRFLKGVMLADSGRTADAMAVFISLNEDYPELPEPYNNLAVLHAGQGNYGKARAALETAVRGNPSYATAWENLGDVYARLAAQAYERALTLEPANAALPPKIAQLRPLFAAKPPAAGDALPGRAAKPASP
jgi:tetratricopeptide (TPR) repeat protein